MSFWRANGPKASEGYIDLDIEMLAQLELELEPNRYLKLAQS